MSNKQWDDLSSEGLENLNIDDIIHEVEFDWEQEEQAQPAQEPVHVAREEVPAQEAEDAPQKPTGWQKHFLVYLHDLVYLLSALVVIFLLLFRVVVVSGKSMNDTLYDGDYLLLLGNTFYHDPSYGDVIVISKENFNDGAPIVKRVIATENQWVDIRGRTVFVGDDLDSMLPLEETYIKGFTDPEDNMEFPLKVSEGCLFVLGDNREASMDSRYTEIGLIDKREVLGKVFFLFLPGSNEGKEDPDFGRVGMVN